MRDIDNMTTEQVLRELNTRATACGSTDMATATARMLHGVGESVLAFIPSRSEVAMEPAWTQQAAAAKPTNGFSVNHTREGTEVTFDAMAPVLNGEGSDTGPQGHIPTPDDVVAVIKALTASEEQRQVFHLLATYLFGFAGPGQAEMYAHQAMVKGPAEQRLQRVEQQAAEFATTAREMVASVKAIGTSNVGNMTSLSERLAAVERHLGLRGSEGAAEVMMMAPPSDPDATAPPPSYEQVAAAERGEPRGGTVVEPNEPEHRV